MAEHKKIIAMCKTSLVVNLAFEEGNSLPGGDEPPVQPSAFVTFYSSTSIYFTLT